MVYLFTKLFKVKSYMLHFRFHLFLVLVVAFFINPAQPAKATPALCFTQTGHCIDNTFASFWQKNGGLAVFGYPIAPASTQIIEGIPIFAQYFERTRIELHLDSAGGSRITLGRIGAELYGTVDYNGASSDTNCLFFAQTNQSVCAPFRDTYLRYGLESNGKRGIQLADSIALFGIPISAPQQVVLADGTYVSQWFERARMLYKSADPTTVSLGLIGVDRYAQTVAPDATAITPASQSVVLAARGSYLSAPLQLPLGELTLTISPNSDATVQLIDGRGRIRTLYNALTLLNLTPALYNDTGGDWYLSVRDTTKDWSVTITPTATNQSHTFQFGGTGTVASDVFTFAKNQVGLYSVHYQGPNYFVMQMRCNGKTTTLVSMTGRGDATTVMVETPGTCRWIITGTGEFIIYRLKSL